ncbi:hypothetical protein A2985_03440 [Candidatus Woesebacteria bacterium RIFCSPLOWO2_01_FULL_43_11]|uniref:Nucleotidyl transferase AbiEii/AbiGii toxin family protein n=1 Tax=Candidatus Woesebacteria bacterium RBG_16_42_24 TaxID=1802485 RepID=A0A1F7XJM8_9BACT|nr:MAG: hypothetical protein A2V97_01165 [Candidatus Woesebacteria bacterium RBG_16_42_24]OGM68097.1 MAG: hypothetical protein A2985_03440 [Candidatus Woesebacteria bacterium RIFCSPLOWO2_01_FULL_43_11]
MFEKVLLPATLGLVKKLTPDSFPEGSYLGGGTAVALQLGHRRSADLDFFTAYEFIESQWEQKLAKELRFKLLKRDWQTLIGACGEVKISLFGYKYPLIGKKERFFDMEVASLPDLAAMKLDTVISRGAKRDLIDIYFLAQKFGLDKLFEYYDKKYKNFQEREIMIKKALVYFEEAKDDEMPDMLVKTDWEEIKRWFREKVSKP